MKFNDDEIRGIKKTWKFTCSHSNLEVVTSNLQGQTGYFKSALAPVDFGVFFVEIHWICSAKYVVLSRPRIMIRHICSISVYILKFVTSTFICLGANGIFQVLSLKIVFSGPILNLVSSLLKCCYKYKPVVSLRQPKNLAETFVPNFLLQFISHFNPLWEFQMRKQPFCIIRIPWSNSYSSVKILIYSKNTDESLDECRQV